MCSARSAPEGARSILEAAAALFAREGYGPVSISQIAEAAGVCKANVFHHYASKEALFMAVMEEVSAEHAGWAEALLAEPGSSAEKLRKLIRYEMETMFAHAERTHLIMREFADHGTCHGKAQAQQVFQRNFSAVIALFEQARASGEFHQDFDPAVAALTFYGALRVYFQCRESLNGYRETAHLTSITDYADRVSDVLLAGVLGTRDGMARSNASAAAEPAASITSGTRA